MSQDMGIHGRQYTIYSRLLHWVMATLVLVMLGIGVTMVTSLGNYHRLVALHRPLGILILVLVVIRFLNRFLNPPPPFPDAIGPMERLAATASEWLLYSLVFALLLVGWGMLSAAVYPVTPYGPVHLTSILAHSPRMYAVLRRTHPVLAYLLFFAFFAHLAAMLFHSVVQRDGVFSRMAPWKVPRRD